MDVLSNPETWIALLTLTTLEIVLGIDNVIFISVIVSRIPEHQAKKARQIGLALALIWLVMAFGFKISSLAALTAAVLMPLGMFYVAGNALVAWAMVPIALILVWRHRANIQQLLAGRERSIGR